MQNYRIAVFKGDGIGSEIVRQAQRALSRAAERSGFTVEYTPVPLGGCTIDATGTALPQETIDIYKAPDAVLLGVVNDPKWDVLPDNQRPGTGLLGIRKALGLFASLHLAVISEPLRGVSPIRPDIISPLLDPVVMCELTDGTYFDERDTRQVDGAEATYDTEVYNVPEAERIAHVGFDIVRGRNGRLRSIDKVNVLDSSRLWRETVTHIGETEYLNIALSHMYVDNYAMQLVRSPGQFDVTVISNLLGNILSGEASMISGSVGVSASTSLGTENPGMYRPVHDSTPDIAGWGIANLPATILSVAVMLRCSLN